MANPIAPLSQNVSRETFLLLERYVALLLKWNAKINLIGPATESEVWSRHIDDALQMVPLIPSHAKTLVDLGCGAGIPGIILAIARPDIDITLVEIDQRKCAFLLEAKRALDLAQVMIESNDIHEVSLCFDVVTARALAPLPELFAMAKRLMNVGAICLFPKGENFANELEAARVKWRCEHRLIPSATNNKSKIILVTELSPIQP